MTAPVSADAFVTTWVRPARLRSSANDMAIGLPLVLAGAALAWRVGGEVAALLVLVAGLAGIASLALWRARRFDPRWLVRQLDATRADMEDSAGLLVTTAEALGPLQRLQRARLQARLGDDAAALRPGWRGRAIGAAWLSGALVVAAALLWPAADGRAPLVAAGPQAVAAGPPRLVAQRLRVAPPAYTGLPVRATGLDARAPAGSTLAWMVRFAPQPTAAALVTVGGDRIALARQGEDWVATRRLGASLLYRVVAVGQAGDGPLHRIDAVADAPPVIRAITPATTLSLMTRGQRRWPLAFEVTDDHGVAATARLRLIVTSGEGENISFREQSRSLGGSGDRRRRRFAADLDIAALGLTPGNDIVAQLIVTDNRNPAPQMVRGTSLILRWPPDLGKEAAGLDGMVKTVLPAYFRSQRQIIIDAEALLKQRRRLSDDAFTVRSDTIGVDQRLLRLRYGGLLGDEASKAPALPTNDEPAKPVDADKEEPPALPAGHADDDGHDHGPKSPAFGRAEDVLGDYGHAHGESEGATLFDPETRATLRQAVDAMWQSELNLRQGAPDKALPHAYAALGFIKKVQQATRIYLSRTGPELPPIDLTRRLGGDRKGLAGAALAPSRSEAGDLDAVPAAAWRALAGPGDVAIDALQRWAATARVEDPLALAAAIDAVARDPGCRGCRDTLSGRLWAAMAPPPAQVPRRGDAGPVGRRYLEALR